LDACPPDTRQEMESYMAMSYQALGDKIKGMEKNAEELKASFKTTFAVLQKKYDEIVTEKEIQISKAKANVKLMKEIIATKEL
jgi:NH3-dependent NAD+ synthetase